MVAKTMSGAAELLHVSQPGVSRALKYMELKLGIELFERRQNGLIPTPEATEIYAEIQPLYKRLDNLNDNISRIVQAESAYIQIGSTPSLSHSVLPRLLASARNKRPNVTAKIETMSNEALAGYIVDRHADVALSSYDPNHPLILAESSINGRIQCVVPANHELAKLESVSMQEIAQYEIVTYYTDTYIGHLISAHFEELKLSPKVSVMVRSNQDACAMVAHGLGVGFAFEFATVENIAPNLKVLDIEDGMRPISIYLLRHRGYAHSDIVRSFYIEMVAELQTLTEIAGDQNP